MKPDAWDTDSALNGKVLTKEERFSDQRQSALDIFFWLIDRQHFRAISDFQHDKRILGVL